MITRIPPMSEEQVEAVLARFAQMREKEPPKAAPNFKAQIEGMAPEIRNLIRKGYGYADIAAAIKEAGGVSMNVRTLRNYVPVTKGKKKAPKPEKAAEPRNFRSGPIRSCFKGECDED